MKDEIKEILDNLKDELWSKTGCDSYDKLLDYITNLQDRIDKAIEYINKNKFDFEKWETQMILNILQGSDE